jgi:hypothetical protein
MEAVMFKREGFSYIRRAYRQASAHPLFLDYAGLLPLFNGPIGIPALIGSAGMFVVQALKRGVRSALRTGD